MRQFSAQKVNGQGQWSRSKVKVNGQGQWSGSMVKVNVNGQGQWSRSPDVKNLQNTTPVLRKRGLCGCNVKTDFQSKFEVNKCVPSMHSSAGGGGRPHLGSALGQRLRLLYELTSTVARTKSDSKPRDIKQTDRHQGGIERKNYQKYAR